MNTPKIERASAKDKAAINELLTENDLPLDGVEDMVSDFVLAKDKSGNVIGCGAIERIGDVGLLRSVAVSHSCQNNGVGSSIVKKIIGDAAKEGVNEIVLLTTTAKKFFETCFGFSETPRAAFDDALQSSTEWNLPRCSSAVVMRKDLSLNETETH